MVKILRWQINRIFFDERSNQKEIRKVHVSIHREAPEYKISNNFKSKGIKNFTIDDPDFWQTGKNYQIDGKITEESIINALINKNIDKRSIGQWERNKNRKLEEDMVFLQIIYDENLFYNIWDYLLSKSGLPDVSKLIEIDYAKWLDFTQQARLMSKKLYFRLLGEQGRKKSA